MNVLISSILQFDEYIHPVVLYEYYPICMFMKIHENLKMRENQVKTISLGEGEIRFILHFKDLLNSCQMVLPEPPECEKSCH